MSDLFIDPAHASNIKNVLNNFTGLLSESKAKKNAQNTKAIADTANNKGLEIKDNSEIFLKEYNTANFIQYCHLYFLRLKLVKENLLKIAKNKWKEAKLCNSLLETKGEVSSKS